jgi:hypothetical protein
MPAMPKLYLNYVMHQSGIKYSNYTLESCLQVRFEKVNKIGKECIIEKISEKTEKEDFLGEE